jgi:hypothetical protein
MRSTPLVLLTVAALAVSVACSTATISVDWDHQVNFSRYKTFAWYDHKGDAHPRQAPNQIVDARIRRSVAQDLIDKGLTQTAPSEADLLVTYYTALDRSLRMYSSGYGYGYWGGWHGWGPRAAYTDVYEYTEGTLVIDLIDRVKEQLVWRGTITKGISPDEVSDEAIGKAVAKVMRTFPPS